MKRDEGEGRQERRGTGQGGGKGGVEEKGRTGGRRIEKGSREKEGRRRKRK